MKASKIAYGPPGHDEDTPNATATRRLTGTCPG